MGAYRNIPPCSDCRMNFKVKGKLKWSFDGGLFSDRKCVILSIEGKNEPMLKRGKID